MIGRTMAHYRITAKLGEGGMGEGHHATATNLRRELAIRILPIPFAADAGRIGRCEREAKMLAWLRTLRLVHSGYFVELDRNWISFPKGTKTDTLTVCPLGVLKVPPSGTSARGERSFASQTPILISSPCLKESFVTPCLVKELGLGISTSHLTTSPFPLLRPGEGRSAD